MIFRYPQIEGHIKWFHRAKGVTALGFESRQGGRAGELGHRGQQLQCCILLPNFWPTNFLNIFNMYFITYVYFTLLWYIYIYNFWKQGVVQWYSCSYWILLDFKHHLRIFRGFGMFWLLWFHQEFMSRFIFSLLLRFFFAFVSVTDLYQDGVMGWWKHSRGSGFDCTLW